MIDKFLDGYERQFDYWEAVARRAHALIEAELATSGLRAIVTSRAKSVDRLRDKLEQRNRKKRYRTVAQVGGDIVDLAGVRVALYFPSQIEEVAKIITVLFELDEIKTFPLADAARPGDPRFSGYRAQHFRVRIPVGRLADDEARYSTALVEIQVASVLMHAWSEVEHDLVYKPLEGNLSVAEYALLDQLNGLVLSGEIALEQLKIAGDQRLSETESSFRDHYELAEFLRSQPRMRDRLLTDSALGSVEVLYNVLARHNRATAADLGPLARRVDDDFEARPVADQVLDLLLLENPTFYEDLKHASSKTRHPTQRHHQAGSNTVTNAHIGEFIRLWAELEQEMTRLLGPDVRTTSRNNFRSALALGFIDDVTAHHLEDLRVVRNNIVHGRDVSSGRSEATPRNLPIAIDFLRRTMHQLRQVETPSASQPAS